MGMIDPPREEVPNAIELCKKAGIRVIMITGDYALTAKAIAKEIGIEGDIITGEDLDKIESKDLSMVIDNISIYARVSPQHKVKILEALKSRGQIVAMTGDGVNDAVALKRSDVGTAVDSGTDVAKEASDIILLDDNFKSIVDAIKEGRGIYNNIKKFIGYLFSCNLAEVLVIFISLLIGLPIPLIAIQILWMNLITDGLPALALGLDKVNDEVMYKPPRNPKESIITKKDMLFLIVQGFAITVLTLGLFYYYFKNGSIDYAKTIAFSTIVLLELFNSINYHVGHNSIFNINLFSNKYLILAILSSVLLQVVVVYGANYIFKTNPLLVFDWILIISACIFLIVVQEITKLFVKQDY